MTILVTGGAGMVGGAICAGLAARGHRVRGVDRAPGGMEGVDMRVAELLHAGALKEHLDGVEAVVHLANHANQWQADARTILAENATLNANVFQAALEAGVRHLVFGSSVQVVSGVPVAKGRGEENRAANRAERRPEYPLSGDSEARPGNAYAVSKAAGEQMLRYYGEGHGVAATTLRLPYIVRKRPGLDRQALAMAKDCWGHEGYAWLWAGDLAGLVERVLATSAPGYRCFLPSAPVMEGIPELDAILAGDREARVAPMDAGFCGEWRATRYVRLAGE